MSDLAPDVGLDAITVGETMVLLTATSDGRLRWVTNFTRSAAGAESNFALCLRSLGLRVGWVGRLGADEFGAHVLAHLRGQDVDVSRAIVDPSRPTGVFFKERAGARTEPEVVYYRRGDAASALSPKDLDSDYIRSARLVHLTGITLALGAGPRATAVSAARIAKDAGAIISFDANVRLKLGTKRRWPSLISPMMEMADLVFLTLDEAHIVFGRCSPEQAVREIIGLGAKVAVVKNGGDGALVGSGDEIFHQPAMPARVVNTHGAGDAFAAGMAAAILLGWPLRQGAQLAAHLGAAATTTEGGLFAIPSLEEASSAIASGAAPER